MKKDDKPEVLFTTEENMDFEQFLRNNRNKVNVSLNRLLWICILAGPAIALGVKGNVFQRTSYSACLIISAVMLLMAGSNLIILKKNPYSFIPGILALVGTDILLCYMNASHISIRLTWFLVPLLSLLFCDFKAYVGISLFNFLMIGLGTWLEAPYYSEIRTDFTSPLEGFINIFAGCVIEGLIMFAVGYVLGKATNNYYRRMISQYAETISDQAKMKEQLDILSSMAEIYDFVNLIDFKESTEMSLRGETLRKLTIREGQDHTNMTQGLRSRIAADMIDDFWAFTDITTVPTRLMNRRSIAGEFIDNSAGWFRAQYIRVKGEISQPPETVIYTIQNIDADKRKEEHLIRISMTDELTRVFNRRCYDEDIAAIKEHGEYNNLAILSADVNGLKTVNDTLGHSAGDELIKGAATCLLAAVGSLGKVYRTGGDEFMAIVHDADCAVLIDEIKRSAASWRGLAVDSISVSAGYASAADYPEVGIEELEKLADRRMYEDKARYYEQRGGR